MTHGHLANETCDMATTHHRRWYRRRITTTTSNIGGGVKSQSTLLAGCGDSSVDDLPSTQ